MSAVGHLAFDEQGRPFFILKNQEQQRQLTGIEATKVSHNCSIAKLFMPNQLDY